MFLWLIKNVMVLLIYNIFFIFIIGFLKKKKENRMGDYLIISK